MKTYFVEFQIYHKKKWFVIAGIDISFLHQRCNGRDGAESSTAKRLAGLLAELARTPVRYKPLESEKIDWIVVE
jgi:hypothetical protein